MLVSALADGAAYADLATSLACVPVVVLGVPVPSAVLERVKACYETHGFASRIF